MFLSDPRASAIKESLEKFLTEYNSLFPQPGEPALSASELLLMQTTYGAEHYYREPDVVLERAEGVWMHTVDGKRYMDANACYSAVALGYGDVELMGAMIKQGFRMTCAQNRLVNDMQPQLLKKIAEITGQDKAVLKNAGTEAFDLACKASRRWAYEVKGVTENCAEIITAKKNFHGRSITAIAASSNDGYRKNFGPFAPGHITVNFGDIQDLENKISDNTAAFIVEVIQGEGGIIMPPSGYIAAVRELCTKRNVLLIFDEIQTGLGRTGKLFASEWEGVKPDGVLLGKALGQLWGVSAFASRNDVMNLLTPGSDGSTFAGTALSCAIALKSLEMITRDDCAIVKRSNENGKYFLAELKKIKSPAIKEVRGIGLFLGIEVEPSVITSNEFFVGLKKNGLIAGVAGSNTLRFTPALVITKDEVRWAVKCIRKTLRELTSK